MSYCPRCGKQIPERTYFCAACGYYPSDSPRERPIEESEANVLSHIYVKQNVRSSGVLASEFEVPSLRKSVGKLEDGGLVVPDKFYRFET